MQKMIKISPYLLFRYKNSNKVLNILKKMFFIVFFKLLATAGIIISEIF